MAWTSESKNMAVNVLAKVEGGGAWDAINYNDPITLGLMQWFGTRAANLMTQMEADHPAEFAGIASSLQSDRSAHGDTSRYWTTRYLTRAEGSTLKPILRASKDTQGAIIGSDVEDYKSACGRIGLDVDTNTDTAIYFMCMYHQSPARAINVMKRIGMSSSLARTHAACTNEKVFSRYKTRYTQAYNYIKSGVPPEIIDLNDDDAPGGDGGNDSSGGEPNGQDSIFDTKRTGIKRIEVVGDQLLVHMANGDKAFAAPTGSHNFMMVKTTEGSEVPDATPGEGETGEDTEDPNPGGGDSTPEGRKIVKFMKDRIGRYGYSQGPGRLKPDQTGVADCSSMTRYAYLSVTGKDIGTYTDAQVTNNNTRLIETGGGGNYPTESKLKLGDLIIMARGNEAPGRFASHVEIYMGNNKTIGHGGPMKGPIIKSMSLNVSNKTKWWVKRLKGL